MMLSFYSVPSVYVLTPEKVMIYRCASSMIKTPLSFGVDGSGKLRSNCMYGQYQKSSMP